MNNLEEYQNGQALIRGVVKDFDLANFQAKPVIEQMKRLYPNEGSLAVNLSKLRSQLLQKVYIEGYDNAKHYFTEMRKQFKEAPLIPVELAKLRLEDKVYKKLNKSSKEAVSKKNQKTDVVKNSQEFLKEMRNNLNKKSFELLMPALLVLTGRRLVEIGHYGKFKKCPKKTDCVLFYGQRKKRTGKAKGYEIPLLAPLKDIQKGLKNLRTLFPEFVELNYSTEEMTTTLSNRFQAVKAKMSNKLGFNISPHSFRSIYAEYAFQIYKAKHPDGMTKNKYLETILGHENMTESLHYNSIKLE